MPCKAQLLFSGWEISWRKLGILAGDNQRAPQLDYHCEAMVMTKMQIITRGPSQ